MWISGRAPARPRTWTTRAALSQRRSRSSATPAPARDPPVRAASRADTAGQRPSPKAPPGGDPARGPAAAQTQTEQVPALVGRQRVQFVEDDAAQIAEESVAVLVGQQQRQARRGHRICGGRLRWRARRLAGVSLVRASAVMASPISSSFEISADVGRQRLERRNIERVQPLEIRLTSELTSGQKAASVTPPVGAVSADCPPAA